MAGTDTKAVKLPVEEEHVASLRNDDALPGELLLRSDGATIRADAHGAGGVEPDEDISRRVADGDGLRLNLGSVNGQGEVLLDVHVNRAGIEGDRQRTAGLENRQMRWTANADLAAFHEGTTSTLMGPVTLMASPSMIPTESEDDSSGRAEAPAISAAQRMAT